MCTTNLIKAIDYVYKRVHDARNIMFTLADDVLDQVFDCGGQNDPEYLFDDNTQREFILGYLSRAIKSKYNVNVLFYVPFETEIPQQNGCMTIYKYWGTETASIYNENGMIRSIFDNYTYKLFITHPHCDDAKQVGQQSEFIFQRTPSNNDADIEEMVEYYKECLIDFMEGFQSLQETATNINIMLDQAQELYLPWFDEYTIKYPATTAVVVAEAAPKPKKRKVSEVIDLTKPEKNECDKLFYSMIEQLPKRILDQYKGMSICSFSLGFKSSDDELVYDFEKEYFVNNNA